MTMKPLISGIKRLASLRIGFNVAAWKIIFGQWEFLDHVVLVQKFILIAVPNMAVMAARSPTKIDI